MFNKSEIERWKETLQQPNCLRISPWIRNVIIIQSSSGSKKVKCGLGMKKLVSVVHENNVCLSKSNFTLKLMVLFEVSEC